MAGQVVQRLRKTVDLRVARAAAYDATAPAQLARNQAGVLESPDANREVVVSRDEIGHATIEIDREIEIRMFPCEPRQNWRQVQGPEGHRRRDLEPPSDRIGVRRLLHRIRQLADQRLHARVERLPLLGRPDPPRGATQELLLQHRLEIGDPLAHSARLRSIHLESNAFSALELADHGRQATQVWISGRTEHAHQALR